MPQAPRSPDLPSLVEEASPAWEDLVFGRPLMLDIRLRSKQAPEV